MSQSDLKELREFREQQKLRKREVLGHLIKTQAHSLVPEFKVEILSDYSPGQISELLQKINGSAKEILAMFDLLFSDEFTMIKSDSDNAEWIFQADLPNSMYIRYKIKRK